MIHCSKLCTVCGEEFERTEEANDHRWAETVRCQEHRKKRPGNENRLPGNYEVNNPLIDKYLRGQAH